MTPTERHQKNIQKKGGYRLRTLDPLSSIMPFVMKGRLESMNQLRDTIEVEAIRRYIAEKRSQGLDGFGLMHVLVAAYIRMLSQRPAVNRYIRGQRIYARNGIIINMTIKKEMTSEAPETIIKLKFDRTATAEDVYRQFQDKILAYKNEDDADEDLAKVIKALISLPRIFLRGTVGLLKFMDYFNLVPQSLLDVSPFHGSLYLTSMGSLRLPAAYHHLYEFGDVPMFVSFGAIYKERELQADGTVQTKNMVDFVVSTDDRICDGFYFASSLQMFKGFLKNPWSLDTPPESVVDDID